VSVATVHAKASTLLYADLSSATRTRCDVTVPDSGAVDTSLQPETKVTCQACKAGLAWKRAHGAIFKAELAKARSEGLEKRAAVARATERADQASPAPKFSGPAARRRFKDGGAR